MDRDQSLDRETAGISGEKSVSFHTLGCKLNFSESSTIARQFEQGGFVRAAKGQAADICVINTCSVTEHADKKCRNLIRRLIKKNPGAIIAVTGCYAQLKPGDISGIEGVDIVIGNNGKGNLFERVAQMAASENSRGKRQVCSCDTGELTGFFASFSTGDRTRSYLKVQDGCSYKCSYCTIPYARGESRNLTIAEAVNGAEQIAAAGGREIVITGINTGDFGRTTGEKFTDLLSALDNVHGIERYRISSIEPNLLTDEVIAVTARSPKFMPHFHIPLQSGSDRVLGLMRRRYTTAVFAERVNVLRQAMPSVFIGIDVIVGFPGETDADFETTYEFLAKLRPSYLHVFPYSERPGTPSSGMAGKVAPQTAALRVKRLTGLCLSLHREFAAAHIGQKARVLFESTVKGGKMIGFTENYIRVYAPYDRSRINRICNVRLTDLLENGDMEGEVID